MSQKEQADLKDCPDPASRHSRKRGCDRCGSRDHPESVRLGWGTSFLAVPHLLILTIQACPTVWRVYAYWSTEQRKEAERKKGKAVGWHKEAVGGTNDDMFCYNCARPGHLGDVSLSCNVGNSVLTGRIALGHEHLVRNGYTHRRSRIQWRREGHFQ